MSEKKTILKVENLSKQYRLGLVGTGTIQDDLKRFWYKIRGKENPFLKVGDVNDRSQKADSDYVWAIKDISFEVKQGEVLGIIGKNGAGKSTLLKILSRVTGPTTGEIKTKGRIASLLEVGTGFHKELTGRENIYLNGAILGMTKAEITEKIDEIISFSGCERYIDTPVKRYSSGMTVRLAFAVAAFLEPDILVIDEVLAVGDAEFQKKAIGKMQDISRGEGRTVLFVSHNMASVKKLCTRLILLEHGRIKLIGDVNKVIDAYIDNRQNSLNYHNTNSDKEIYITRVEFDKGNNAFLANEDIKFNIRLDGYGLKFSGNFLLIRVLDGYDQVLFTCEKEIIKDKYFFVVPKNTLVKGFFKINCILYKPGIVQYDNVEQCCEFNVIDNIDSYSHLETFDIGKIYVSQNWLK